MIYYAVERNVGRNIVNKLHHIHWRAFGSYLYIVNVISIFPSVDISDTIQWELQMLKKEIRFKQSECKKPKKLKLGLWSALRFLLAKFSSFCRGHPVVLFLTPILLTWTIWRAATNASKWRMGFNSAFKGLTVSKIQILPSYITNSIIITITINIINIKIQML